MQRTRTALAPQPGVAGILAAALPLGAALLLLALWLARPRRWSDG